MCWSGSPGTPGMDSFQEAEKRTGKMFNAQSQRMDQIEFDALKKEVEGLETEVDNLKHKTLCLLVTLVDVRVFCKDDKPSDIKVGTIKADKPSGLRLADLANVIGEEVLVKVVYQIASTICSIMVSVVTSIIITREYMSVTQNEVDRMFNMSIKLVEVVAKMMADRFGTDQK